jgi:hypothetical protein
MDPLKHQKFLLSFSVQSIVNKGFGTQFNQHTSMKIISIKVNHVENKANCTFLHLLDKEKPKFYLIANASNN